MKGFNKVNHKIEETITKNFEKSVKTNGTLKIN